MKVGISDPTQTPEHPLKAEEESPLCVANLIREKAPL